MIRVEVVNTFLVNMGKSFVILLRSTVDEQTLPISIGQLEAQSIAFQLNRIPFPRPLTHDLFKNIINELNGKVLRTEICTLKDDTFYARLIIEVPGKVLTVDSRPSDGIAMALRFSAPIFVDEAVMEVAGIIIAEADLEKHEKGNTESETFNSPHEATTSELLRKQLDVAINEERYEDAAQIRDEISKFSSSN